MSEPSNRTQAPEVPFEERTSPLTRNIGRPRTLLDIGLGLGAATVAARARGTRLTGVRYPGGPESAPASAYDEIVQAPRDVADLVRALGDRTFDAVCVEFALLSGGLEAGLRAVAGLLDDGGHVLVDLPLATGDDERRRLASGMSDAGLELLRVADRDDGSKIARVIRTSLPWPGARLRVAVGRRPPRRGKLSITVGMLTLNEEEAVEKMIAEIRAVAPDARVLLIDSSSDQTPDIASRLGARVVRQLPPRGHAPAMHRLMYEAARDTDALVYLDCDFTYPASTIPRIRELLEGGADLVNATRTQTHPEAMPFTHFLANRFFAAATHAVHGVPTTDVHSGMRGYRSSMIRAFDFDGGGDALPIETLVLPARSRYHVVEMPIPYFERVGASKLARVRGTVWTFARILSAIGQGDRVRPDFPYQHIAQ